MQLELPSLHCHCTEAHHKCFASCHRKQFLVTQKAPAFQPRLSGWAGNTVLIPCRQQGWGHASMRGENGMGRKQEDEMEKLTPRLGSFCCMP